MSTSAAPRWVRRRLLRTLLVPVVVAATLATVVALIVVESVRSSDYVRRSDRIIADAIQTQKLLIDLETGVRGFLVTGDGRFLEPYQQAQPRLGPTLARLRADRVASGASADAVDDLSRGIDDWRAQATRLIELRRGGAGYDDIGINLRGKQAMDGLRARIAAMVRDAGQRRDERLRGSHRATVALIVATMGSILLLGGVLTGWAYRALAAVARGYGELQERVEHDQFRLLVDAVRDYAIVFLDADGTIQSWNIGAQRLKGYTPAEAIGRSFTILYPPESVQAGLPFQLLERARREGRVENEGWRIRKDGSRFWANVIITALREPSGEVSGFVKVTRDLTVPREREHAIMTANEELESFAYAVSHDLRAPLRAVDGFSLALLEDHAASLDASGQKDLQRIRAAAQRMAQLIDDLLRLSRITRAELRKQPIDLTALCASIVDNLRQRDPDRRVDVQIAPGLCVDGDPQFVRIAMENLIGNAWKFTSHTPDARIEIGRAGHELFARDNGAGFDPAQADRLFKPFQRLHRTDEFEGTGIGLATVLRIVRRHSGHLRAEAGVGKGATFYFSFFDGATASA